MTGFLPRRPAPVWVAGFAGLALLSAGCTHATNSLHPGVERVAAANGSGIGAMLVDEEGRALYMFVKDPAGRSSCYGACASVWPAVTTAGPPAAADGADGAKLSTAPRRDGGTQVVYNGHPLYYYQADTSRGDAYGEGLDQFGGEWYAVTPGGEKAEAEHQQKSGGGGYGS